MNSDRWPAGTSPGVRRTDTGWRLHAGTMVGADRRAQWGTPRLLGAVARGARCADAADRGGQLGDPAGQMRRMSEIGYRTTTYVSARRSGSSVHDDAPRYIATVESFWGSHGLAVMVEPGADRLDVVFNPAPDRRHHRGEQPAGHGVRTGRNVSASGCHGGVWPGRHHGERSGGTARMSRNWTIVHGSNYADKRSRQQWQH